MCFLFPSPPHLKITLLSLKTTVCEQEKVSRWFYAPAPLDFDEAIDTALLLLFFNLSVVDLLLCLEPLLCCLTSFQSSFSCQTENLTLDSRILWCTEEFAVNSSHLPHCAWQSVWDIYVFLNKWALCHNISTLVSFVFRILFQKLFGCFCPAMFFIERGVFLLTTSPNKQHFFSLFLIMLS